MQASLILAIVTARHLTVSLCAVSIGDPHAAPLWGMPYGNTIAPLRRDT